MTQAQGYTQRLDSGLRVVVERTLPYDVDEIWRIFTTAEGLDTWIGVLRGSKDSGDLTFSMVDQGQEANPAIVRIHRCRAPFELSVSTESEYGNWHLGIELARLNEATSVKFIHDLGPSDDPSNIGPGWEYYMERVAFALGNKDANSVLWDDFYPVLAEHYTLASGEK